MFVFEKRSGLFDDRDKGAGNSRRVSGGAGHLL